jgi:hypothetical protein
MYIDLHIKVYVPKLIERLIVAIVLRYRRRHYGYAFRKIKLTQGQYAIVDPQDFDNLNQNKWYAKASNDTFYAQRRRNGRVIHMHRQIMQLPDDRVVDHENHNGLDNRRANLKIATISQNNCNRRKMPSRSKYRGIWWHKPAGKWEAAISYEGRYIYLGLFDNEIDVAKAYDEAARQYHGQFAVLNFEQVAAKTDGDFVVLNFEENG